MRGQQAFDLVSPLQGVRFDIPDALVAALNPYQIPGYLRSQFLSISPQIQGVGTYNTFIDEDGALAVREGYFTVNGTNGFPSDRLMGIYGSYAATGSASGPTSAYVNLAVGVGTNMYGRALGSGGVGVVTWQQIGGPNMKGSADQPVRMVAFPVGGTIDFCAVNQGVPLPALGRTTFSNGAGGLLIYSFTGLTLAGALKNTSFQTFATPFSNAVDIEVLTNRLVVVNVNQFPLTLNSGPYRVQWSAINNDTSWPALSFADLSDGLDQLIAIRRTSQTSAALYRERSIWNMYAVSGNDANCFGFERIPGCDGIIGPVTPAAVVSAAGQQYYMGQDNRIYQFTGSTVQDISVPIHQLLDATMNQSYINRTFGFWIQNKNLLVFVYTFTGSSNPQCAIVYNLRTQSWDSWWVLTHPMSAGALVPDFAFSLPISEGGFYNVFLAPTETSSLAGNVQRFFSGQTTDSGTGIPFQYTSPLFRIDATTASLVDAFEAYFKLAPQSETVTVSLIGLQSPYDNNPVVVATMQVDLSNPITAFQKLSALTSTTGGTNNTRANWLKLVVTETSTLGQMGFNGGEIWVNPDPRGDSTTTR